MKKFLLMSFVLVLAVSQLLYAQGRVITGSVISGEDNTALPGVNVLERGTTNGTTTGPDGNYRLTTTSPEPVLVFRFVGFTQQEVPVGGRTEISVTLAPDVQALSEVVVVGYGTQLKQDLTGSVARVTAADIENIPVNSFEAALQGRTPGVNINMGSGKLGQGVQIRVRGASSLSASNQPLFVIDGIPVTSEDLGTGEPLNPMADINPNDIESFEILKDASAAAIYGSRAANGVILITTKRGRVGKTKINLGYYTGSARPTRLREWLNADEYRELFSEAIRYTYELEDTPEDLEVVKDIFGAFDIDYDSPHDTDWQREAFQRGGITQYDLSMSGGNEKTRFFVAGTHNYQKGIIIRNAFERSSGRVNLDHEVNRRFRVGTNISLTRTRNFRVPNDRAFSNPLQLVALPPLQPVRDETGGLNFNTLYYNNLIEVENASDVSSTYRTLSSIFGSYELVPGLVFRSELGIDFLNLEEDIYRGRLTESGGPDGYGFNRQLRNLNYTTNNTLTYNRLINDIHNIELLGGITFQEAQINSVSAEGRGFPDDRFRRIASAAQITGASTTWTGYSFLSYIARANYKLNNRFLLSLNGRVDGSSRFGRQNRYGFFPAASVGYILSEEAFLADSRVVSFLKPRVSYGLTGNAEIANFAPRGLYSAIFYANQAGIVPTSLPSPDLKWENTRQFNVGIDYGFLDNRIQGEVDFYHKLTTDLLLALPLPGTSGFGTITRNVGSLENYGLEFVINTENIRGPFRWNTSFNIATNRNMVLDLNEEIVFGGGIGRAEAGRPLGSFFTYRYAGVDPDNGDALYFVNATSNETTNDVSEAERQWVGNPNPRFFGGFDNRFSFMGFDFNVLFQFVQGVDIYNQAGYFQSVNADFFDNQSRDQMRRWQQPGDITDVPQARLFEGNGAVQSSRWVHDGSFIRLKTMNFGYTIPKAIVSRARMENARVYVAAQNLFTFTRYPGWDPEVNSFDLGQANLTLGHDFYTPPQNRIITIGVNIGF
jgi:TonB-dependent starch-binding outer membrane protein SusC